MISIFSQLMIKNFNRTSSNTIPCASLVPFSVFQITLIPSPRFRSLHCFLALARLRWLALPLCFGCLARVGRAALAPFAPLARPLMLSQPVWLGLLRLPCSLGSIGSLCLACPCFACSVSIGCHWLPVLLSVAILAPSPLERRAFACALWLWVSAASRAARAKCLIFSRLRLVCHAFYRSAISNIVHSNIIAIEKFAFDLRPFLARLRASKKFLVG